MPQEVIASLGQILKHCPHLIHFSSISAGTAANEVINEVGMNLVREFEDGFR